MTPHTSEISIAWHAHQKADQWVYGSFQISANGSLIGNNDPSTALNIVFGWIESYLNQDLPYDPIILMEVTKEDLVSRLHDAYMVNQIVGDPSTVSRYDAMPHTYISYLGDSAFYGWMILLINGHKHQRLIWTQTEYRIIHELFLPSDSFQNALTKALSDYLRLIK